MGVLISGPGNNNKTTDTGKVTCTVIVNVEASGEALVVDYQPEVASPRGGKPMDMGRATGRIWIIGIRRIDVNQ